MKRERLEDLGRLAMMLKDIKKNPIFDYTESKHAYESWVKEHHDKIEIDNEIKGLDYIFRQVRYVRELIEECCYLADGEPDD